MVRLGLVLVVLLPLIHCQASSLSKRNADPRSPELAALALVKAFAAKKAALVATGAISLPTVALVGRRKREARNPELLAALGVKALALKAYLAATGAITLPAVSVVGRRKREASDPQLLALGAKAFAVKAATAAYVIASGGVALPAVTLVGRRKREARNPELLLALGAKALAVKAYLVATGAITLPAVSVVGRRKREARDPEAAAGLLALAGAKLLATKAYLIATGAITAPAAVVFTGRRKREADTENEIFQLSELDEDDCVQMMICQANAKSGADLEFYERILVNLFDSSSSTSGLNFDAAAAYGRENGRDHCMRRFGKCQKSYEEQLKLFSQGLYQLIN